jgi:hypothetical protein
VSDVQLLLLPAFVHVALVFYVGVRMGRARFRAARAGRVKVRDVAVDGSKWPDDVKKFSNNYANQFEVPVLYYAALGLMAATGLADMVAVVLSWVFVASRVVHSVIHTGRNVVIRRFQVFLLGFVTVLLMWAWFGLRLYVIG